jgi:hypothetical protein
MTGDDDSLNSIDSPYENDGETLRIPDGIVDAKSSIVNDPIPIVELPWEFVRPHCYWRVKCPHCDLYHVRWMYDPPASDKLVHYCFELDKRKKRKRNG